MNRLYIFRDSYEPNTATLNRFLGFVKGFSQLGIYTTACFIRPNGNCDKVPERFDNITFNYLWDRKKLRFGKFKYIQQIWWIISFLLKLKRGDNIILFGTNEFLFVFSFFKNKINLYHEITEHPDIGRNRDSKILNFFHKLYLKDCKSLKGLFVISISLKKYFSKIGVPQERIHVINMIVDSTRFEVLKKNNVAKDYIAYCGSIVNSKDGVDTLIKSFKVVSDRIRDLNLYLIGDFPFKEDKIINFKLIEEYHLQNKIVFTGKVPANEMPQLLKNAHALVLARPDNLQAQNGFPTKLGEYLLTANPVVVTGVGEIPLFLKDGESAFIAEPGDIDDIAEKIYRAVVCQDEASKIGKGGCTVAMEHFNYKKEAEKIVNVVFGKQKYNERI